MDQQNSRFGNHIQMIDEGTRDWNAAIGNDEENLPKLVQFLVKHSGGLIKNSEQATKFLLYFSVFSLIITGFLLAKSFFGVGGSGEPLPQIYREDLSPDLLRTLTPEQIQRIPYRSSH